MKVFKYFVIVVAVVFMGSVLLFLFKSLLIDYRGDFDADVKYKWIFKDSIKSDIDSKYAYSYVRKNNVITTFHYENTYVIQIIDFKDVANSDLNNVSCRDSVSLSCVKFYSGKVLDSKSSTPIDTKTYMDFRSGVNLNLDKQSTIIKTFESVNYKGIYGMVNQMSLSNGDEEHQMVFKFKDKVTPFLFLFYKKGSSLYAIIIFSDEPFDESIIEILNLQ